NVQLLGADWVRAAVVPSEKNQPAALIRVERAMADKVEDVKDLLLEPLAQRLPGRILQAVELHPSQVPKLGESALQILELLLRGKGAETLRAGGNREHPDRRPHPERRRGLRHLDVAHDGSRGQRGEESSMGVV